MIPFEAGSGKPEAAPKVSGFSVRRIDDSEHRLVYRAGDDEVTMLKARYHY